CCDDRAGTTCPPRRSTDLLGGIGPESFRDGDGAQNCQVGSACEGERAWLAHLTDDVNEARWYDLDLVTGMNCDLIVRATGFEQRLQVYRESHRRRFARIGLHTDDGGSTVRSGGASTNDDHALPGIGSQTAGERYQFEQRPRLTNLEYARASHGTDDRDGVALHLADLHAHVRVADESLAKDRLQPSFELPRRQPAGNDVAEQWQRYPARVVHANGAIELGSLEYRNLEQIVRTDAQRLVPVRGRCSARRGRDELRGVHQSFTGVRPHRVWNRHRFALASRRTAHRQQCKRQRGKANSAGRYRMM